VVQRIEPSTLELGVDRRGSRKVPVRVAYTGQPAPGYAVASTQVDPERVLCSGPATRLAGLRQVPTQPVDLSGRTGKFSVRVDLLPGRDRVQCAPQVVTVEALVERERQRALLERPVTLLHPPAGLAVDVRPARVAITVSGPQDAVEGLDPDAIEVVLDAATLRAGDRRRLPLEPRIPGWARLDALVPDSVDVVVRQRQRRR
jgi:YbbR domain-containing protein